MRQERARRILELLGWGPSEAARRYNAASGARYNRQQIHKQVSGDRAVSDGLAVFLKAAVQIACLRRRLARLGETSVSAGAVEAAAGQILRSARDFPGLQPEDIAQSIALRARAIDRGVAD